MSGMLLNPFWSGSAGGGIISAGLEFDLNARIYGSTQTWANQVASPASGAAQTAYDFYLGLDGSGGADDPTYSAVAPAAFTGDGAQYFTHVNALTTFINRIAWGGGGGGKTITLMAAIYVAATEAATFSTTTSLNGFEWWIGNNNQRFRIFDTGIAYNANGASDPTDNAWNIVGVSFTEAAPSFHYLNGAYNQVGGSDTFTLTNLVGGNASAQGESIFSRTDQTTIMGAGSKIGRIFCYNVALTKAQMDTNYNAIRGYYGI